MSEELAKELQNEENLRAGFTPLVETAHLGSSEDASLDRGEPLIGGGAQSEDVSSDWLMAQMLQKEFDEEHDKRIKSYEKVLIFTVFYFCILVL